MKFFTVLILWLSLTSAFNTNGHEFYLSVTDINYIQEKETLQIISRVFTDDFEDVINKRYNKEFKLIPNLEVEEIDIYIEKYLRDKFVLETNNGPLTYNYLGRKYENDMVYLFLEVENLEIFEVLTVENLILTDLFEEQKNMIHFKSDNFKKSFILEKDFSNRSITYKTKQ
ncbi:hypothetical protein LB456_00740 [Psychroflexus sp. CAK57W]|uniref:DUF6702 family protein n=1 Tax=Psychroflexus curvus TaxID=2873595 RepID=UPI001CCA1A23|nr:DUF6702 family protein [Psychroflexus curvus]MBZ9627485.1 hypothetical protein [Psychroflexus curvus]MBZ9785971.1 hypothetical protein [Psychroflexus curvus]